MEKWNLFFQYNVSVSSMAVDLHSLFTLNIALLSFQKVAVKASLRLIGISLDSYFRK